MEGIVKLATDILTKRSQATSNKHQNQKGTPKSAGFSIS
jgi:hypothetical protein